jgi:hypothetical protein
MDEYEVMIELLAGRIWKNLEEPPPEPLHPPQISREVTRIELEALR